MIEAHAFGNFVPPQTKYLILGSFTGKEAVQGRKNHTIERVTSQFLIVFNRNTT
jgi:hypothetical protein